MLYVTTRSNQDAFTPHRTLSNNRGPCGGLFIPFREPTFTQEEMAQLKNMSFSKCVADVLNKLFRVHLTSRDVELAVGRYPVRVKQLNQRLLIGESWHNLESSFPCMVRNLTNLMRSHLNCMQDYTEWSAIAIRIAVIFGIFGEFMRLGIADNEKPIDIAVVSGDFSAPISAWYARRWGLPIGNIVCCCNENGNLWNFICHGQLRTDGTAKKTHTPDADVVVPNSLERLICTYGGYNEVSRYLESVRRGVSYYADDKMLCALREGIYATVSSERRVLSAISGVYATHRYLLSPYGALAYAGLQDYRSRTGESNPALILTENSPVCDAEVVATALSMSKDQIKEIVETM